MYTDRNFKTKKALREAFERGESIFVYQPGPFGEGGHIGHVGAVHQCALEGPHSPQPHTWYASGFYAIASSQLLELKGSKAKWVNGVFVPAPPKVTRTQNPDGSTTTKRDRLDRRLVEMSERMALIPAEERVCHPVYGKGRVFRSYFDIFGEATCEVKFDSGYTKICKRYRLSKEV